MHFQVSQFSFLLWKSCLQKMSSVLQVVIFPPCEERKMGVRNVNDVTQWLIYVHVTCWVWGSLCFFPPGKALTCLYARVRVPHPLCSAWHRSWGGGGTTCSPVFAGAWCYTTASTAVEEHPCYPHPQLKVLLSWRATSCISARKLVPQCLQWLCSSPCACLHQWFKHCSWKLMRKI